VETLNIGIIGAGNIFDQYIKGCRQFSVLNPVAVADLDLARAQQRADQYGITALSVDDLLARDDVQIIVNLTVPAAHVEVDLKIVEAGKHVYSEKPFALDVDNGRQVLEAAERAGVRVGCAPDTFLGGGGQTARKLIEDGWIGEPVAATAFMLGRGPESWHPNPDFFYQYGGGPLFDMGPYYLTALINLLGPVRRIAASTRISFPSRTATSEAQFGREIPVEVATHTAGVLDFVKGPVGTLVTSFDVWASRVPRIEIYGAEGTLSVPDPNTFRGPVEVWLKSEREWREIPLTHSSEVGRGIGVADMAHAVLTGRPHRASGEMAFHVLEAMAAYDRASEQNCHIDLSSQPTQPAPLPLGLAQGLLDD
jgi:predicted dehydrogenase